MTRIESSRKFKLNITDLTKTRKKENEKRVLWSVSKTNGEC